MTSASGNILLVDDMPDNLQVLSDILIREGYTVRPVTSGAMAFKTMAVALPDLVLADIKMPGMDGFEFCRRMKEMDSTREIPVIFVSALGETKDKVRAFEAGGVDYVTKPFQGGEVIARVRTHLAMAELRQSQRRLNAELEARAAGLEAANLELAAFSYSVSHDLRAPIRAVEGFSRALLEDCQDRLDDTGRNYLGRIIHGAQRMGQIIDDLLALSKLSRVEMRPAEIDLSGLCGQVLGNLAEADPGRTVATCVQPGMTVRADAGLLRVLVENLLGNAWKFTSKVAAPSIEVGETSDLDGGRAFFIRDNGDGFDMAYAGKLFRAFERLHRVEEFAGTGIGLAIVRRIALRHGGRVWAKGEPGRGAEFGFSLGEPCGPMEL